MVAVEHCDTW